MDINEKLLVKECIAGNRQYQELLYQIHAGKMMGICMRYMHCREDAEDILQESFIKIYNNIQKFEGKGSLEGWIRKIIINTILESFRKSKTSFSIEEIHMNNIPDNGEDIISEISKSELVKMIQELSPAYRLVFNLFAIEGFSHKEIASRLGISEGTSKSNYSAARKKLQVRLSQIVLMDTLA